ncbi:hypothetical protein [Microvirga sp. VF16]|uniref:hypothetical protein n=1 Tax=Microvirga sp. VF16 TaxID=2807101 RepID=UPI00193D9C1B|nr:hypothetical protein [Microvirga sp. VF16]QRM27352.1 hypothetical protein JO965_13680 [Microvirga sp. VF16]
MRHDAADWIGLLAVAIALHGWHHGFRPIYPGDIVALAVIGLILAYCIRGPRKLSRQEKASERIAFRLGQALKRVVQPL